jgi:hypothetical protein
MQKFQKLNFKKMASTKTSSNKGRVGERHGATFSRVKALEKGVRKCGLVPCDKRMRAADIVTSC